MTDKWIAGAGGGGGGKGGSGAGGSGDVAEDNLNSYQIARLVDLLCEGEIEGFPSASGYTRGTETYNIAASRMFSLITPKCCVKTQILQMFRHLTTTLTLQLTLLMSFAMELKIQSALQRPKCS